MKKGEDGMGPSARPAILRSVPNLGRETIKLIRSISMGVLIEFIWKLIFTFCAFILFLASLSFVMATFIYHP